MLTKYQLTNRPPKIEAVPAPEFGENETVGVKLLSAAEFLKLSADAKDDADHAYAHWIIAAACDEAGNTIFTAEDFEAVKGLPFSLVTRVIDAAQKINGTAEAAKGN